MRHKILCLIWLSIIGSLNGKKHQNSCETTTRESPSSSSESNSCDHSQTDDEYSSDTEENKTKTSSKMNNLLFVPYPFPIMVHPLGPPPAMPFLPPPMPPPLPPNIMPTMQPGTMETTAASTKNNSTTITNTPSTEPSRRKSIKGLDYNDIPNFLLKNGIIPVPDTIAKELVSKMHEIDKENKPDVPRRRVDQSIFKFNNLPKKELIGELKKTFDTAQNKDEENYDVISDALEDALFGLTKFNN